MRTTRIWHKVTQVGGWVLLPTIAGSLVWRVNRETPQDGRMVFKIADDPEENNWDIVYVDDVRNYEAVEVSGRVLRSVPSSASGADSAEVLDGIRLVAHSDPKDSHVLAAECGFPTMDNEHMKNLFTEVGCEGAKPTSERGLVDANC